MPPAQDPVTTYGFTAVARDAATVKKQAPLVDPPKPLTPADLPLPTTPLIAAITTYAKAHLPPPTYNHSLRVYLYGTAMRQHFPAWATFTDETYLLCSLLHDIGTTPAHLRATRLSFETYGGMLARAAAVDAGAEPALADAICEAVVRHQDVGPAGRITAVGQLLQLATIFDNMGGHAELVARETIEAVVAAYPRLGWSRCFHDTIREENSLKPWAHTTVLGEEEFPNGVLNNELMAPYDESK